ncbi:hypothetical protein NKH36_27605 [Mesorhizobium sp. M1312]|uniref:hypothetical protein n=1 Tax=unclassified Mesorhizobium TaxID=325217 RepID=UPI00333A4DE6
MGGAIGLAALLAPFAVLVLCDRVGSRLVAIIAGFAVAFLVYELVLFAATAGPPSGDDAFSLKVIMQILWLNVLALIGLALLHRVALSVGLLPPREAVRGGTFA